MSVSFLLRLQPCRTYAATTLCCICCIFAAPAISNASPLHLQPYCASASTTDSVGSSLHTQTFCTSATPSVSSTSLLFYYFTPEPELYTATTILNLVMLSRHHPCFQLHDDLMFQLLLPGTNLFFIFEYLLSDLRVACS